MNIWIEKTLVKGKQHKINGDRALGKVLWSPRAGSDGRDTYKNMRLVMPGDMVIHFIDNASISGVSLVENSAIETDGLAGTPWDKPAYLIKLQNYTELNPQVKRYALLNDENKTVLQSIAENSEVFYNNNLNLRQGGYLSPCTIELFTLINNIYKKESKGNLPFFDELRIPIKFQPENIKRPHVIKALKEIDLGEISIMTSTKFDILYEGKTYPPKEVMRLAHQYANGEYLWEITGGEPTNKYVKALGFLIVNKGFDLRKALQLYISRYKELIVGSKDYDELYKWEAVATFQKNWDLSASDLPAMIETAFPGNNNLWVSNNYYPIGMLKGFSEINPDKVVATLNNLFSESEMLENRILAYKNSMEELLQERNEATNQTDRQHYQDGRTIGLLLAFNAPSKHFLFKYGILKKFCSKFALDAPKKGDVVNQILINNEISGLVKSILLEDKELLKIHKERLTGNSFKEDNYNLLTQDFIYSMVNYLARDTKYWLYAPGENAEMWKPFYKEGVMALGWDELGDLNSYKSKQQIVKRLQELGNSTGSKKNDATANDEFINHISIGDIVLVKKGRGTLLGYGEVASDYYFEDIEDRFKSRRKVSWKKNGTWDTGKINLPLKTLTNVTGYKSDHPDYDNFHERLIGIMENENNKNKNMESLKFPLNQILYGPPGTGKTYKLKEKYFEKFTISESTLSKEQFILNLVDDLTWWQTFAIALYDSGKMSVNEILEHEIVKAKSSLSSAKNIRPIAWSRMQAHAVSDCPNVNVADSSEPSLFYKEEDSEWRVINENVEHFYPEGIELLEKMKKHQPRQDKAVKNYEFVTFHQSYSYEDFIEGIKPKLEDESSKLEYEINDGIFKKLCQRAEKDLENNYAIFIDEINRGNVSGIFGELITLIEDDKRIGKPQELRVKLPYSKTEFGVPPNLFIIGTMNTADRSVEALDTALRRRFSFVEINPNPKLLEGLRVGSINLNEVLQTINERVELLVDRDHTIGHAYLMNLSTKKELARAFANKIIPLLQEYFYGDYGKIGLVLGQGFIEKVENKKVEFAAFKYEGQNDFKTPSYILKPIDEKSILPALELLLGKKEIKENQ